MIKKLTQLNDEIVYFYHEMGAQRKHYMGYNTSLKWMSFLKFKSRIKLQKWKIIWKNINEAYN